MPIWQTAGPAVSAVAVTPDGERTVISTNNVGRPAQPPGDNILDNATALLVDGHLMDTQIALARAAE